MDCMAKGLDLHTVRTTAMLEEEDGDTIIGGRQRQHWRRTVLEEAALEDNSGIGGGQWRRRCWRMAAGVLEEDCTDGGGVGGLMADGD
jgi:hypothetical protein